MAKFELYHPILSAHYRLDWLTTFTLKDVYALRADAALAAQSNRPVASSIQDAAKTLNRAMLAVMENRALLYGIGDRQSGALLGSAYLHEFAADRSTASLQLELLPTTARAVGAEILPRIAGFGFFELGLHALTAHLPETATAGIGLFQQFEFTAGHDAEAPGWLTLSLQRDTVAGDQRFMA